LQGFCKDIASEGRHISFLYCSKHIAQSWQRSVYRLALLLSFRRSSHILKPLTSSQIDQYQTAYSFLSLGGVVFCFNPDLKDQVRSGWLIVLVCACGGSWFHCFLYQRNCAIHISRFYKLKFCWLVVGWGCDLAVSKSFWLSLNVVFG
jgi:hypothetical protein